MATTTSAGPTERPVEIPVEQWRLQGTLCVPLAARGVVAFARGSGSGRFSPRNQFVAKSLQASGLATLLIDLLGDEEAADRQRVFDVELLATRLEGVADWLDQDAVVHELRLGYFGASTGAAAAVIAAARQDGSIGAVVSRGGRPDLAWDDLPRVAAPTLLIVGGNDHDVLPELQRPRTAAARQVSGLRQQGCDANGCGKLKCKAFSEQFGCRATIDNDFEAGRMTRVRRAHEGDVVEGPRTPQSSMRTLDSFRDLGLRGVHSGSWEVNAGSLVGVEVRRISEAVLAGPIDRSCSTAIEAVTFIFPGPVIIAVQRKQEAPHVHAPRSRLDPDDT